MWCSIILRSRVRPVQSLVAVGEGGEGGGAAVAQHRVVEYRTSAQRSCRRSRRELPLLHLLLLAWADHRLLVWRELGDVRLERVPPGEGGLEPLEDRRGALRYQRRARWGVGRRPGWGGSLIVVLPDYPGLRHPPHELPVPRGLRRVVDLDCDRLRNHVGVGWQLLVDDARRVARTELAAWRSWGEVPEGCHWLRHLRQSFSSDFLPRNIFLNATT